MSKNRNPMCVFGLFEGGAPLRQLELTFALVLIHGLYEFALELGVCYVSRAGDSGAERKIHF